MPRGKTVMLQGRGQVNEGRKHRVNVVSSGRPKRPSKLLDALRGRAQAGGSGRLGFGASREEVKRRLTLVASLTAFDRGAVRAVAQAGADGVEVTVTRREELAALGELVGDLGIPVGVILNAAGGWDDLRVAVEAAGIDWMRFSLKTTALSLTWEKPARFITIPEDLEPRRVPALNVLEVDAVVIEGSGVHQGGMRIEDALRLAMLGELCKKPLFLDTGLDRSPDLAAIAEQCGINGLVYSVEPESAAETVAGYRRALETRESTA